MSLLVNFNIFGSIVVIVWSNAILPRTEGKPLQQFKPGCRYEGRRYREGSIVTTSEPCLQCRCAESSLRCRLRVCPRIPNPPPPECHLRVSLEHVCCAEMICGVSKDSENSLRKMDTDAEEDPGEDGCLYEGARYGAGSAMMSTRRCEYCYCISGTRRCVRPKCLLPLPGCVALYAPHSCCPVAYNCTTERAADAPTTLEPVSLNGCRVGSRVYNEGEMVHDVAWKGTCDNCFCAMGAVRCVPLACAPPLQGCSPVVREGQCCPSTYNCSGSIEVKATQNYASYAFVSKDYANFRKETNFYPVDSQVNAVVSNAIVEGRGHRVIDDVSPKTETDAAVLPDALEAATSEAYATNPNDEYSSTIRTEIDDMPNEIYTDLDEPRKSSTSAQQMTTTSNSLTSTEVTTDSEASPSTIAASSTTDPTTSDSPILDSAVATTLTIFEDDIIDKLVITTTDKLTTIPGDGLTTSDKMASDTTDGTATTTGESILTTTDAATTTEEVTSTLESVETTTSDVLGVGVEKNELRVPVIEDETRITERAVRSTTPFSNSTTTPIDEATLVISETVGSEMNDQKLQGSEDEAVTTSPTAILMPNDIFVVNVTLRTNVSVGHVQGVTVTPVRTFPPDVEAILNITQRAKGEDYDYYSEPTLPPSLPNVRIIPFVAADALVKNEKDAVTAYPAGSAVGIPPELHPTDSPNFYDVVTRENRFSPPVETEGGFVPRDPPYFEPPYHSTDLNLEIGTGVTVVPGDITNPNRKAENGLLADCRFKTRNYHHGELIPNNGICVICICYYGEVVCSDEKCPPLKIGCRRIDAENECCGKLVCVDTAESPTMVLDRADATAPSQRQPITSLDGTATSDPFRDVIKTKPAPDLPSLIEDMIPYLVEHRISTPKPTTPMTTDGMSPMINAPLYHNEYHDRIDDSRIGQPPISKEDGASSYDFDSDSSHPQSFPYPHRDPENKSDSEKANGLTFSDTVVAFDGSSNSSQEIDRIGSKNEDIKTDVRQARPPFTLDAGIDAYSTGTMIPLKSTSDEIPETPDVEKNHDADDSFASPFAAVFDLLFNKPDDSKSDEQSIAKLPETSTSTISHSLPSSTTAADLTKMNPISSENLDKLTYAGPTTTTKTTYKTIDYGYVQTLGPMKLKSTLETEVGGDEVPKGVGSLLKLAGCNIYGRMYRVGKIITELSGPCLECRCTEIGVQCKKLLCS